LTPTRCGIEARQAQSVSANGFPAHCSRPPRTRSGRRTSEARRWRGRPSQPQGRVSKPDERNSKPDERINPSFPNGDASKQKAAGSLASRRRVRGTCQSRRMGPKFRAPGMLSLSPPCSPRRSEGQRGCKPSGSGLQPGAALLDPSLKETSFTCNRKIDFVTKISCPKCLRRVDRRNPGRKAIYKYSARQCSARFLNRLAESQILIERRFAEARRRAG
jgi:hypothetical protein